MLVDVTIIDNKKELKTYERCDAIRIFDIFVDNFIEDMIIYNDLKSSLQKEKTRLTQTIYDVISDMMYEMESYNKDKLVIDNLPYSTNTVVVFQKSEPILNYMWEF